MPHLADRILTPSRLSAEGVLFDVPLRPYPGKPIVCMVPRELAAGRLMIPPEVADKYQPDFGVVAKFAPRIIVQEAPPPLSPSSSAARSPAQEEGVFTHPWDLELRPGMLVAIRPYTGAWFTHADFPWIPEGRVLKILGTVEDWSENVLAAVETGDGMGTVSF